MLKRHFFCVYIIVNMSSLSILLIISSKDKLLFCANWLPLSNKVDIFIIFSAITDIGWVYKNKKEAYDFNVSYTIKLIEQISNEYFLEVMMKCHLDI